MLPDSVQVPEAPPEVSIVVPVFNEEGAVDSLVREMAAAFAGWKIEILMVNDRQRRRHRRIASRRSSPEVPALRVFSHCRNAGQEPGDPHRRRPGAARAAIAVMLDGDGQNDPADAPRPGFRALYDWPTQPGSRWRRAAGAS